MMIDARLGISPINYDENAHPVFFVNKKVWCNDYIKIIREALYYRNCYLIVDYGKRFAKFLNSTHATIILSSLLDFERVIPQIEVLLGINKKGCNKDERWKKYYDKWALFMLSINEKEDAWDGVIKKYGHSQPIGKVNIFDALYEYAIRFGEEVEDDEELETIVATYRVDGYVISMVCSEKAEITIFKEK